MRIPRIMSSLTVAAVVVTTACASTSAPRQQPQPQPQLPQEQPQPQPPQAQLGSAAALLEPPEPARRAAANLTPTGSELGTMWTFENAPVEYWRERYGFTATKEWLDNVRLASVRYGESCSASFVSPEGLVMTNHHCARECIEAVSNQANDYVVKGFSAATREQELLCPELFLDQLIEIQNVKIGR